MTGYQYIKAVAIIRDANVGPIMPVFYAPDMIKKYETDIKTKKLDDGTGSEILDSARFQRPVGYAQARSVAESLMSRY
jgi:hypothetical protein